MLLTGLFAMSQANPLRIFVTHLWENSDDYLRVFEYLESSRNFFYRNFSTPDQAPVGDKETKVTGVLAVVTSLRVADMTPAAV